MRKTNVLTALLCVGLIPASILLVLVLLAVLGFNEYTIYEGSYKLPGKVGVGVAYVFVPTYRETVLTAPTWLKKPGVSDEVVYWSSIKLGEQSIKILCIGSVKNIVNGIYLIENPREVYATSISIGNMTSTIPSLCGSKAGISDMVGVVVLKARERYVLPLLIAFVAAVSSTFSVLFTYIILKHRKP